MNDTTLELIRGGWQDPPGPDLHGQVSFATPGLAAPNLWHRALPSDPYHALAAQETAEQEQAALVERIQGVPAEMEQLARGQVRGQISYAVPGKLTEEQQRLLEGLRWVEDESKRPASYAIGAPPEPKRVDWAQGWEEFRGLMTQVERLVGYMAWVETDLGGEKVARTIVNWTGDARTEWMLKASDAQAQVHENELAQALAQRLVLIQIVTLTAQSAAKLSATLTIPGGGLLAIPQVWQYVRQVIGLIQK